MNIKKNTLWNIIGSALPLLFAITAIPYLIHKLGNEAFGILTLAWALIGYLSLFDFGISKALTYEISIASRESDIKKISLIFLSGMSITALAGFIGALLMSYFNVEIVRLLKISDAFKHDAELTFIVCGLGVIPTTLISGFRGALEGLNRFPESNIIKCLIGIAMFLLPVLTAKYFTSDIWYACLMIVLFRVLICIVMTLRFQYLLQSISLTHYVQTVKKISKYCLGVWVSSIISPLMVYGDRFFVSAYVGAAMLPTYSIPQEGLLRILILPTAYSSALFPKLSHAIGSDKLAIYKASLKKITLIMFAVCALASLTCHALLSLWISKDFANSAFIVCQVLIIGMFINSVSLVPSTLIQASGNTKAIAISHLIELGFYICVLIFLTRSYGINGAAFAWLARQVLDMSLLFLMARKHIQHLRD